MTVSSEMHSLRSRRPTGSRPGLGRSSSSTACRPARPPRRCTTTSTSCMASTPISTASAAASTYAIRKGFHDAGVEDNQVLIFSELMGSESRVPDRERRHGLLPGIIDLTSGPMVVETPPQALGTFDDMWFGWIIDFGLPGPDRGEGGRFLLVPPGYDGPLPDSGYHVGHSRTSRALLLGRSFLTDDDPAPTVETIKSTLKIYPYAPGASARASPRCSRAARRPLPPAKVPETVFVEGSGQGVQHGAAERLRLLRADERGGAGRARRQHRRRAHGAAGRDRDRQGPAVRARRADATDPRRTRPPSATRPRGRCSSTRAIRKSWRTTTARRGSTCCGSAATRSRRRRRWSRRRGSSRSPRPASRKLALAHRVLLRAPPGSRPRCACASPASGRSTSSPSRTPTENPFDGAQDLPGDAAAGHPGRPLLVAHRSTTTRRARCSRRRSASRGPAASRYPTPAATANADGSTTVTFGPEQPDDAPDGNWIQTTPKARAGSCSCASTARSSRSSTRAGGRARSSS